MIQRAGLERLYEYSFSGLNSRFVNICSAKRSAKIVCHPAEAFQTSAGWHKQ